MLLKKYIFIFLALVFISASSFSRDYYVDARGGNNSNSGQSPASAWKSISRVNTMSFAPGDRILFKRGEIWQENTALLIKRSGTSSSRIVYGAYGTGNKPIISLRTSVPGWKSSGSWSNQGNSVWRFRFPYPWKSSHKLRRLWLDGKEYSISAGNSSSANNLDNLDGGSTTYGTNSLHRFYSYVSNGTLYLYVWTGGTNPANYYSTMEYSGVAQSNGTMDFFTVAMSDADYITLEDLDLRGGLYGSIGMRGSDYTIIDNCSFGKYSQYVGVMCASGFITASDATSDNGIIIEGCRNYPVKHLIFASSSSVYGNNKQVPYSTSDSVDHPISLYAATKKSNELMAYTYSHLFNIPATGLRFFTVYGPWGRPDMAYFSFTRAIIERRPILVYNYGDMKRDFTYIDDITNAINLLIRKPPSYSEEKNAAYSLYNIGNNDPTGLMRLIRVIEECVGRKAIIQYAPMQPGDVFSTYADIDELAELTGFRPVTDIETGISKFVQWYNEYFKPGVSYEPAVRSSLG